MRDISGTPLNEDALIVGISVSGLWMYTTRFPRIRMALKLLALAWWALWWKPKQQTR